MVCYIWPGPMGTCGPLPFLVESEPLVARVPDSPATPSISDVDECAVAFAQHYGYRVCIAIGCDVVSLAIVIKISR